MGLYALALVLLFAIPYMVYYATGASYVCQNCMCLLAEWIQLTFMEGFGMSMSYRVMDRKAMMNVIPVLTVNIYLQVDFASIRNSLLFLRLIAIAPMRKWVLLLPLPKIKIRDRNKPNQLKLIGCRENLIFLT